MKLYDNIKEFIPEKNPCECNKSEGIFKENVYLRVYFAKKRDDKNLSNLNIAVYFVIQPC